MRREMTIDVTFLFLKIVVNKKARSQKRVQQAINDREETIRI